MSTLPLGRLFGLASVVFFAATLSAQLTTYTYQGKPFTTVTSVANGASQTQPLITTDAVSGQVTFFSPLPPNQFPAVNVISNIASYSFTDGSAAIFGGPLATSVFGGSVTPINTWNSTNSTMDSFIVGTDSQGQIIAWSTQIFSCCVLPVPPPQTFGDIAFEIFTCGGVANACASTGQDGAFAIQTVLGPGQPGIFELINNQGTWGSMSISPPLQITTASLPNPLPGQPYSATITATGGTGSGYVWSISKGAPPPGFTFTAEGTCGPACATVTLSSPGDPTTPAGAYNFTVQVTDSANHMAPATFTFCLVNVQRIPGGECASKQKLPTSLVATFVPPNNSTLHDFAQACGFNGFDWQQIMVRYPGARAYQPPAYPIMTADGINTFLDPPQGGWTYEYSCMMSNPPPDCDSKNLTAPWVSMFLPHFANAYPLYYSTDDLAYGCAVGTSANCMPTLGCQTPIISGNTLTFLDMPMNTACNYPNACITVLTRLVGLCDAPSARCNAPGPSGTGVAPLSEWRWDSNFNGTSGGIFNEAFGFLAGDLDSGTGGVTITSINGVPQTPPSLTCSATPTTLWPPDGKQVLVTVSGTATPGSQPIPDDGGAFSVADEYQQVQPIGSFTVGAGGSYSYTVPLIASRNGDDLDGRTYTVVTVVTDNIGNAASCSSVVTVPHDQGN